jgi:serine O-acetyltransferase
LIQSYQEYLKYLEADRLALGVKKTFKGFILNDTWKFQRILRRREYLENCNKNFLLKVIPFLRYRFLGRKLGFSIPLNVFGPGLSIVHSGTIVVSKYAKVGENCRIHVCVNIGASGGTNFAPIIGNNCYIAPGAKIFGKIILGNNIAIGANAVVNRSFPDGDATIGGIPAKIISKNNSHSLLKRVTYKKIKFNSN